MRGLFVFLNDLAVLIKDDNGACLFVGDVHIQVAVHPHALGRLKGFLAANGLNQFTVLRNDDDALVTIVRNVQVSIRTQSQISRRLERLVAKARHGADRIVGCLCFHQIFIRAERPCAVGRRRLCRHTGEGQQDDQQHCRKFFHLAPPSLTSGQNAPSYP